VKRVPETRDLINRFVTATPDVTILWARRKTPLAPAHHAIGKGARVRIKTETALTKASGALGIVAALTISAPIALADPEPVGPAPGLMPAAAPAAIPAVAPADPVPLIPGPAPAPVDPAVPTLGAPPGPAPDGTVQAAAGALPTPPDGMQHLSSPENLPPGTTASPDPEDTTGSYIRDLWHAYQTQEITGRDALLLLTQRPMDANAAPPAGMPANPTPPLTPGTAPPPAPEPEPAPAPPPPLFPWLAPPPEPAPTP